jgi:hypothetical protein
LSHAFAVTIPQMPPFEQSAVVMQLPATQSPETQTYPEPLPYAAEQDALSAAPAHAVQTSP